MTPRSLLVSFLLVAGLIGSAMSFVGCCKPVRTSASGSSLPAALAQTQAAAKEISEASASISTANQSIAAAAPAVSEQTASIARNVGKLEAVSATLAQTSVTLDSENLKAKDLADQLASANEKIASLESTKNGLLSRLLAFAAVSGLGLAVVAGVWLRSASGFLTGLAIFGAAIAGQWVLEYRAIIGLSALGLAGVWAAVSILRERKAAGEIVTTVEAVNGMVPNFEQIADSLQTRSTKAIVNAIQKAKGFRK